MITSYIGKIFLEAFNEKYGTNYDAKSFFLEEFWPLFLNHDKHMMALTNSPFAQSLPKVEDCIKGKIEYESDEKRQERLDTFVNKADNNKADASIAVGYQVKDITKATSSQVTDVDTDNKPEDTYLSWIGAALGVGVSGGWVILFSNKRTLLDIYEGWKLYRRALDKTKIFKGNQINTWNGQWLSHYYDKRMFDVANPFVNLEPYKTTNGIISVATKSWTEILIRIAQNYQEEKIIGYVWSVGKTNSTIGYVSFNLPQIRRPQELYEQYFGMNDGRTAEKLWGTEYGFEYACKKYSVGTEAMAPKGLSKYIQSGYNGKYEPLPKTFKDKETRIKFNVYKILIIEILGKKLSENAESLAKLLNSLSVNKNKPIQTKNKRMIEKILSSTNKTQFYDNLGHILKCTGNIQEVMNYTKAIVDETSNFREFLALVRLYYHSFE